MNHTLRTLSSFWTRRRAATLWNAGCLVSFLALGGLWLRDRTRVWEVPEWNQGRFNLIDRRTPAAFAAETPARDVWVVAVNPDCGHCAQSLRDAEIVCARRDDPPALHALIVDQDSRPSPSIFHGHHVESVWWDEHDVWRQRWGHRVYGEVLRFDAAGRHVETWSPDRVSRDVPDP